MREMKDVRVRKLAIIGAVRKALQECGISHESCIIADDAATRAISDLFALEPAPKAGPQIMFVCDYCSEHNPEMCGYYDADQVRLAPNGQWLCECCYDEATTEADPRFSAAPTHPAVDAQDVGEVERLLREMEPHVRTIIGAVKINDEWGRVVSGQTEAATELAGLYGQILTRIGANHDK